jgi:peptidoglycan/LPS O-acetylase OafA/YrhL
MVKTRNSVSAQDRLFLNELRGASILRVVMVHLGLSWFFLPYSSYVGLLLPILFFVSGAATYFSFLRSSSAVEYLLKRLMSIYIPFLSLGFFIYIYTVIDTGPVFSVAVLWDWLLIYPRNGYLPFELGQVWYLQALVIVMIAALPFFILSRKYKWVLFLPLALSMGLMCVNVFIDMQSLLKVNRIDFYQGFANTFFFFLGGVYFSYEDRIQKQSFVFLSVFTALLFFVFVYILNDSDYALGMHMESPDILYLCGFLSLFSIFLHQKKNIVSVLERIWPLKQLFLYCSNHSYSIYLLHTLVIMLLENYAGLDHLTGMYALAILKMILVIVVTLLIAPVFTRVNREILLLVNYKIISGIFNARSRNA